MPILRQWDEGGYGGEWVFGDGVNSRRFREAMLDDDTSITYEGAPVPSN